MSRIGDFVAVNEVAPVVQLAVVREAPRHESFPDTLAPLVDGYLVVEGANAAAVHGLLSALPTGGAFLLSGVYGTGKSHLLAFLGLLAEFPEARQRFTRHYPTWAQMLQPLENRRFFVTYISLDEFDPTALPLETVVAREIAAEAARKNFSVPTDTTSRSEWLRTVWQTVQSQGFAGLVVLLDELAMFLNAKSGESLNRDASFLQFLAQATLRFPLLLVGALQRGVEDLQRMEPYALTQVRDRFQQTWLLGLAHALPLVQQVLLRKKQERELLRCLRELRSQAAWAQKFSLDELFACYPFHPLTLRCLERSVGAFFSRTRSIVTFVQTAVKERLDAPWDHLITPDTIVDHFEPDLAVHPLLRPFAQTVLPYFQVERAGLASRETLPLVKTLLSFQLGGEEPSAQFLADALMQEANEVWAKLEQLRTNANFVDAVRRTGSPQDTYRLDPQITVTEAFRRRLSEKVHALADDDPRLVRFSWECRGDEWALPPLFEPRTLTTHWLRTQRRVVVTATDLRRLDEARLQQIAASLASAHTDECLHLFLALPTHVDAQLAHFVALMDRVHEALAEIADEKTRSDLTRFVHAVVALLPREPNEAERLRWRENAAVWLLCQDLSLAESDLEMKVLERAREILSARQWETQRLLQRLYGDGILVRIRDGGREARNEKVVAKTETIPVRNLVSADFPSFDELVRAVAESVLPQVFPAFPLLAPRREASGQTLRALAKLLLRGLPPASLDINTERWLELVALPLGVVERQDKRLTVAAPNENVREAIMNLVGNGAPYSQVESALAKSKFGLPPDLSQLVIAALLRLGWLVARDRNGKAMPPEDIAVPLNRSIATLSPAELLSNDEWTAVRPFLAAVLGEVSETITPETQQRFWSQLRERLKEWKLTLQDVNARLTQWQRELRQSEIVWRRTGTVLQQGAELVALADEPLSAADGLRSWADRVTGLGLTAEALRQWQQTFETAAQFFAAFSDILAGVRYLRAMGQLPQDLADRQLRLLEEVQQGEALLSRWREWLKAFHQFRSDYIAAYIRHHERAYRGAAWVGKGDFWRS